MKQLGGEYFLPKCQNWLEVQKQNQKSLNNVLKYRTDSFFREDHATTIHNSKNLLFD